MNNIIVGYDGSVAAHAALDWAEDEAFRRHIPVRLVCVYEWAATVVPVRVGAGWPDPAVRREAVAAVDEAVARARPGVSVTGTVVDGPIVPTLHKLSEHARLVVLGERGLGGSTGLLAGSVAVGVATHATCPVVVVRGTAPATGPVVVGVDDADHTIGFAFDQAAARCVELVVVCAWQQPPVPWRTDVRPPIYDVDELETAERQLACEALPAWQRKYSELVVRIRLVPGTLAHALIAASADAQLVVVGSHGRGAFGGLLLGSVTRQVVHHARCPVAVVRYPTASVR